MADIMVERRYLRVLLGALSMASIFCLIEPIHREGLVSAILPLAAVLLSGFLFGVANSAAVPPLGLRGLLTGMVCGSGAILFVGALAQHGEARYEYVIFPPAGFIVLPLLGVYFNLLSAAGSLKVSLGNSISKTSISIEDLGARLLTGLLAGFLASGGVVVLAVLHVFLLGGSIMLFVEGLVLGGLLAWRRI
jgi:hypothetical protein